MSISLNCSNKLSKLYHSTSPQTPLFIFCITDDPGTNYPLNTLNDIQCPLVALIAFHWVWLNWPWQFCCSGQEHNGLSVRPPLLGWAAWHNNYFMIMAINPACCIRWSHLNDGRKCWTFSLCWCKGPQRAHNFNHTSTQSKNLMT